MVSDEAQQSRDAEKLRRHTYFHEMKDRLSKKRKIGENLALKVSGSSLGDMMHPSEAALKFADKLVAGAGGKKVKISIRSPIRAFYYITCFFVSKDRMRRTLFQSQRSSGPSGVFRR